MRRALVFLVAAASLLTGCAGLGGLLPTRASEEERTAFAQAMEPLADDPALAEQRLEAFLRAWPKSPLASDAAMQMAEIALARGDRDTALRRYYFVVRSHPDGDRSDAARVEAARLEYERGNVGDAARIMGRTRLTRLSPDERRAAYRVLADVLSDPVARLRFLSKLRAEEPDEDAVALIDVEIDEILRELDARSLDRASGQLGSKPPAARVLVTAAERALEAGDFERARAAAERAGRLPLAPQYAGRLRALSGRLGRVEEGALFGPELPSFAEVMAREPPSTAAASGTLGVVLPLSGRFARFGEESLQGILLAAGVFGAQEDGGSGPTVRVLIRDSAGRPEQAAQAVRELARNQEVAAVVGPLLKGECEAAAAAAESAGMPLLTLTARTEVARERPYVFRLRTAPGEEVRDLVDHAMRGLGALSFAILYPRDAYGRGLRNLFWDAVEEHGGEIVAVAAYDPEATDFGEPIRRLVGYVLLSEQEKALIQQREAIRRKARRLPAEEALALRKEALAMTGPDGEPLPPIVDFDALFIPESHEKVVLLAPQLAFHEATGARLLGPSGWYDPELVSIGRHHVEGAVFAAHFFPDSPLPFVQRFVHRFQSAFATAPDAFAAQGFDAANLILVQLAQRALSRADLRDGVVSTRAYPGVTGALSILADGNAHKRPFLLGIQRGRIIQVE
jgi:ABC-type branched-subunit amino acid transport system substrate-binding protein